MLRRFVLALVVVAFTVSVSFSDTFTGLITGAKDGTITVKKFKDKQAEEPVDLKLAKGVKLYKKGMKGTPGELDVEGKADVLKADFLAKIGEKGAFATITTDDTTKEVTEIRPGFGGKKKKDKTDK